MEYENSNGNFRGNPILASLICFIVAAICIGVGIFTDINRRDKLEYYESTVGVIVDYTDREPGSHAEAMPIYEYEVGGEKYRRVSNVKVAGESDLGHQTTIYYNPSNPQESLVDSSLSSALYVLGGFFGFFCLIIWVSTSKRISSDVQYSLTGFLIGLLFTAFPIGCLLIVKVNLLVRLILGILCVVGVIILGSTFYVTFINKDARKNRMSYDEYQQKVDEKMYEIENNAQFQKAKEVTEQAFIWQRRIGIIFAVLVIIAFVFIVIKSVRFNSGNSAGTANGSKTQITDELLSRQLNCSVSDMPEYIVFERKIIDKVENYYYLEETGGLNNIAISNEEYEVGETVYWIEFYGDYTDLLCDMDDYVYEGTNIPANSPHYSSDGMCYIDDAFLENRLGSVSCEILEVEFTEIDDTNVVFTDGEGCTHVLKSDDVHIKEYDNSAAGDAYYWIVGDNGALAVKANLYIYNAD